MDDRSRGYGRVGRGFFVVALIGATIMASVAVAATPNPAMATRPKDRGPITPQVVGGQPVDDGQYPFVVAVLNVKYGRNAFARQFCGGSLIDPAHVLTAAHCLTHPRPHTRDLRVVVGRTRLRSDDGTVRRVDHVQVHPQYAATLSNAFDLAVLTLEQPVLEFAPIQPAASGDDSLEQPGRTTIVAGWGSTTARSARGGGGRARFPDRMREADVAVVSDSACAEAYDRWSGSVGAIEESLMLCAASSGRDSCQGDSGGPIFVAVTGGYRQLGVVSFGLGCADPDFPGVYTQLSAPAIAAFIVQATGAG